MKEFTGNATSAKVFVNELETTAEEQIKKFLDHAAFEGLKVRIMPDVHAGSGAVIGFTSTLGDKIIPNVVGVDIGCGILTYCLGSVGIDDEILAIFDKQLRRSIPSGFSVHQKIRHPEMIEAAFDHIAGSSYDNFLYDDFLDSVKEICARTKQDYGRVLLSIGTLGGGNHFIELDKSKETGNIWLTIHSGSRNFGLQIANFHQAIAVERCGKQDGLEFLEGEEAQQYYRDMQVAQMYALLNRQVMLEELLVEMEYDDMIEFETKRGTPIQSVHNYIDFEHGIIRKGAISAREGEEVVIPWNMRDGVIIGVGLGNDDWNQSAPHGAGRKIGRNVAKKTLKLEDFAKQMKDAGIWSSCIGENTLDEAPDAYKPSADVEAQLVESVRIVDRLIPIYNFKADESRRRK